MISSQETLIRNKITGVLLRQARLHAGKSVDRCAATLSCDPAFLERAEEGREALTLPQLEALAQVLEVPIQYLFGEQELPAGQATPDPVYYARLMTLRRKIVGVILQQTRLEVGQTLDQAAAFLGWEPERLGRVEWGEEPISWVELQVLAGALGIPLERFIDSGEFVPPPAESHKTRSRQTQPLSLRPEEPLQSVATSLTHLPVDVQEFVAQPINAPYLQVAMSLSRLPADILRQLASGLFEITY